MDSTAIMSVLAHRYPFLLVDRISVLERGKRVLRANHRKGFGFEVIELLFPYELGGSSSVVVEPEGLRCSLTFPVPPHELL